MPSSIKKCLFPVAGLGTRFLPATKEIAKEMLPLVDRPIIAYGVEEALAAGCREMVMITGRAKKAIEDYFDRSFELEEMLKARNKRTLYDEVISLGTGRFHLPQAAPSPGTGACSALRRAGVPERVFRRHSSR